MTPKEMARCLKVDRQSVRRARSKALTSGLFEPTTVIVEGKEIKGLKRTIDDPKEFDAQFRPLIGHKVNVMITVMALAAGTKDYRVRMSRKAMAKSFDAHSDLSRVITKLEKIGLLGMERGKGGMNVYWPNIKRSAPAKVTKGGTVAEVLRLECGITSERSVELWEEMVRKALRALTLVEDSLEMTRRLWRLLCAITEERNASHITEDQKYVSGNPRAILERYLDWLLEQDRDASGFAVLEMSSRSFIQFRRQDAQYFGAGLWDTITGKEVRHGG